MTHGLILLIILLSDRKKRQFFPGIHNGIFLILINLNFTIQIHNRSFPYPPVVIIFCSENHPTPLPFLNRQFYSEIAES
jgi:hypothetical protein